MYINLLAEAIYFGSTSGVYAFPESTLSWSYGYELRALPPSLAEQLLKNFGIRNYYKFIDDNGLVRPS